MNNIEINNTNVVSNDYGAVSILPETILVNFGQDNDMYQMTPEQIEALGLKFYCENGTEYVPQSKIVKKTEHIKNYGSILDVPKVVYQIVKPEELNLKPKLKNNRGRPKRESKNMCRTPPLSTKIEKVISNGTRTRSGRVIQPPKHVKHYFEKVKENETISELKISEPLQTNQMSDDNIKSISVMSEAQIKRQIASQFRCPTCHKAYLGRMKLLKHLAEYPDHGPVDFNCNDLWQFLIENTLKYPTGQRGLYFGKQLTLLFQNLKNISSVLFKNLNKEQKNLFFIDETLSKALDIEIGYAIDETIFSRDLLQKINGNNSSKYTTTTNLEQNAFESPVKIMKTNLSSNSNQHGQISDPQFNFNNVSNFAFIDNSSKQRSIKSDLITNDNILILPTTLLLNNENSTPSLLDNSVSSDEILNVDQFVNERFKNLTEPDFDITSALPLDLL